MHRKSIPRCCAVQSLFLARTERAAQVSASVLSALKPESGHRSNRATAPRRVCLRQIRDVNERPVGRQLASNPQPNVGSLLVMAATWASFDLKMTPPIPLSRQRPECRHQLFEVGGAPGIAYSSSAGGLLNRCRLQKATVESRASGSRKAVLWGGRRAQNSKTAKPQKAVPS